MAKNTNAIMTPQIASQCSVETGVGGQAKYDVMMVFCGNALHCFTDTSKNSQNIYKEVS